MKLSHKAGVALLLLAIPLGGCAVLKGNINNVSPKAVFVLRNGYDAGFLAPASTYAKLSRCAAGVHFSVKAPCSEFTVIQKLQQVDKVAEKALNDLQTFVIANPKLDATALYQAAQMAITNAENVITTYNLK